MTRINAALSVIKRFVDVDPQQAAIALEGLPEAEAAGILRNLPTGSAAVVLEHVQPSFAAAVLQNLVPEPAHLILQAVNSDTAAEIFRSFPAEIQRTMIESLSPERQRQVQELLFYPEDSAGRLMTTDVLAFPKDLKVREVIARLRATAHKKASTYSYVVGPENKLIGVINIRDLLLASPEASVETVMRLEVFAVPAFTDREELVHIARAKHFISIPVVDADNRLLGAVMSEHIMKSSHEEATEDLQLMFGASKEERAFSPLRFKVARRLPWLNINLATAFLASFVVGLYEDLIAKVAVLAVFLPIVAGQGGNAGTQSLAVVLRGIVMREVRPKDALRLIALEVQVGLLNGLGIGLVTAVCAWLWKGNVYLGFVIGVAMIANMIAAGLAGAAIPLLMKRLGFDPAQSSGIFLTTVTDVVGFLSFLGIASVFQDKLI
jgi:magnesium transporter